MLVRELIERLKKYDEQSMVILTDTIGWSNIDEVKYSDGFVCIEREENPIFSDN